jgi:hypothetical protein
VVCNADGSSKAFAQADYSTTAREIVLQILAPGFGGQRSPSRANAAKCMKSGGVSGLIDGDTDTKRSLDGDYGSCLSVEDALRQSSSQNSHATSINSK